MTILIQTSIWGELEIPEQSIYGFPKGLPGFDGETMFALIPWKDTPFFYLQSTHHSELSFLVVNPFEFVQDYSFELSEGDKEELRIQEQVSVFSIVTIQQEATKSTMNLLAPLVLNPVLQIGKQVVLHHSSYDTRHLIWKGGV